MFSKGARSLVVVHRLAVHLKTRSEAAKKQESPHAGARQCYGVVFRS